MQIEVLDSTRAVAERAADILCGAVAQEPRAMLGLPTGQTPVPLYAALTARAETGTCDFGRALGYAIDEFCGVARLRPGTNAAFYAEHLRFGLAGMHCPDAAAEDPALHISAYADAMSRAGGLDVCVLGIGGNGHIAFNEPGSAAASRARVVELAAATRAAHAAAFGSLEAVPQRGMTLGVADLLEARAIIVLATGLAKAGVVRAAIEGVATADVPATWLQGHADVTWLLDADAASLRERRHA